jgi:Fe-S cluster assembly protein SufB
MDWLEAQRAKASLLYQKTPYAEGADSPTENAYVKFSPELAEHYNHPAEVFIECGSQYARPLAEAQKYFAKIVRPDESKAHALHYSIVENGLFIRVPENTDAGEIRATVSASGEKAKTGIHTVIALGKNAKADYFETAQASGRIFLTGATEIILAEGARLNYNCIGENSDAAIEFCVKKARLEKNAQLAWSNAFFGGETTKAAVDSHLEGTGARAENYSAFLLSESGKLDLSTNSFHHAPDTSGEVLSKGIAAGESASAHRGLIYIGEKANRTNCFLTGHSMILGGKARANSVPSLEIRTNDVQSRHAASVDHLDEEKVFYMQSRGFPRKDAESELASGFLNSAFEKNPSEKARAEFESKIGEMVKNVQR